MKLGIIGYLSSENEQNYELFKSTKEQGLEFLELCINVSKVDEKPVYDNITLLEKQRSHIKNCISETGVTIDSIGRWGSDRIDESGKIIQEEMEQTYKLIDIASEIGCKNFICGCNYVEGISYYKNVTSAIKFFGNLIEYTKNKNVKIATYNCRWNNFIYDPFSWKLVHGELPELGIKFDPSHSIYAGGDYLKEMIEWGHKFNHIHIKGSLVIDGKRYDDPPAGLDQTDWGSFMSILYALKYEGGLSIEPHSHNWKGDLGKKGVEYTIDFMRKLIL